MPNTNRKRSNYVFDLSPRQVAGFVELSRSTNKTVDELITEALDRYIEKELPQCPHPPK